MSFLPIAHRELISAARKRGTWIRRTLFFATMLVIAAFVLVDNANRTPASQGEELFGAIAVCLTFYAATIGIHATADAFGWEKREGTLGLLFLTDLSGTDVVAGKLAAKATNAFYGLLSMLPLLAMPLLLGGVRLERVVLTSVMLIATSIASLSIGLWVSSRSTNERRAMMLTFGLLLVYLAGPIVTAAMSEGVFGGKSQDSWKYGVVSPLMGLLHIQLIQSGGGGAPAWPRELWIYSLVLSLLVSVFALVGAARHLPHSWSPELLEARKKGKRRKANSETGAAPTPAAAANGFKQKIESWKRHYAKRQRPLLNIHPYIWLGERFADKRLMAGVMTALILAIPFIYLPSQGFSFDYTLVVPFFYIAALLLLIWMIAEPIVRLNEDRRAGALELILTTPLQGKEIVRGMQRSMQRIFLVAGGLLALAAAITSQFSRHREVETWAIWVPFLFVSTCFISLRWIGPWVGLSSKSVTTGMLRAFVMVLLPSALWIGLMVMFDLFRLGRRVVLANSSREPVPDIAWLILLLTAAVWLTAFLRCRRLFLRQGRSLGRNIAAFGLLGFLAFAAFILSFLTLAAWEPYIPNGFWIVFLALHATGLAVIAYGWAKPQLELRFRDLATRPFES